MVELNPSSDTAVLAVQEAVENTRIFLVLDPFVATPGQSVEARGYLETVLGVPVVGVTVRLEDSVGNNLGTDVTDAFGNSSIFFTSPPTLGSYTYTIFFDGVSGYAASSVSSELQTSQVVLPEVASMALAAAPVLAVVALVVADVLKRQF